MYEKTVSSEIRYRGRIVDVEMQEVELETGQRAAREIVRHRPAVAAVAKTEDGRWVFLRQFRKPAEKIMFEVVAGIREEGEDPERAIVRELKEETGYRVVSIERLGKVYPSPGYVDEEIDIFLAQLEGAAGDRHLDPDERIEVLLLTRDEVWDRIRRGDVEDSKTLAAWALFASRSV